MSFVAVRGDSYLGDIALDEIAVNEAEECKVLKEIGKNARDVGQNPKEGEFPPNHVPRFLSANLWFFFCLQLLLFHKDGTQICGKCIVSALLAF